jgi:hypothetical protein
MGEAVKAAEHLGWDMIESDGVSDYQGWGVLLLRSSVLGDQWAVLSWTYGSCSGCDSYEEQFYDHSYDEDSVSDRGTPEHCARVFGGNIETCPDEESARMKFSERKGW